MEVETILHKQQGRDWFTSFDTCRGKLVLKCKRPLKVSRIVVYLEGDQR